MSVALVGMGRWGKNLARNFHVLGALHTICEVVEVDIPPKVKCTSDFQAVLDSQDIDKVVIATPALTHFSLAKRALLAGKDVFVEKPLCTDSQEAEELVLLAKENGRILMVGHLLHYHPCVAKLKELVSQGVIGEIQYLASHRVNLAPTRPENVLWDLAPHDISVLLSLDKALSFRGLSCSSATDTATLLFDRAHIFISWKVPYKEQRLVVQGSCGTLVFDDVRPWGEKLTLAQAHSPYEQTTRCIEVEQKEPLYEECAHFLSCCETRTQPLTSGKEGLRVIRLLQESCALLL